MRAHYASDCYVKIFSGKCHGKGHMSASGRKNGAKVGVLLGIAACAFVGAHAVEPSYEELKSRVVELEYKVEQIAAQKSGDSRDVAATIDAVLRDAERRSQLLANGGGVNAGYDNGFFIQSDD